MCNDSKCFISVTVGHKRSITSDSDDLCHPAARRSSPSEKARFHFRTHLSVMSVGHEMSLRDPHYKPSLQNPFATLPRLREGRKLLGSSKDLFSSCFELPSPGRATTPVIGSLGELQSDEQLLLAVANSISEHSVKVQRTSISLPSSPTTGNSRRSSLETEDELTASFLLPLKESMSTDFGQVPDSSTNPSCSNSSSSSRCLRPSASTSRFEEHLFQGRVQLLKRLYSGGNWMTQDDTIVDMRTSSKVAANSLGITLRRRGSCESGFYSVGTDDLPLESGMSSTRSLGSSLLTVSDLEEDLRAASAFLSHQRTSSVFTDSNEDLASLATLELENDVSLRRRTSIEKGLGKNPTDAKGYEKDIRNIVEYFEASCRMVDHRRGTKSAMIRSGVAPRAFRTYAWQAQPDSSGASASINQELPRSQKIDSLIKRVVEKESRERFRNKSGLVAMASANFASNTQQRMQVCDGIVRSKLPIFDQTKRTTLSQKGFVKSKMAIFDNPSSSSSPVTPSSKQVAEMKLAAIVNKQKMSEECLGNKLSKNAT